MLFLLIAASLSEKLIFEAESAVLQGDCTIEHELAGYSGTGYVYMHDSKSITWRITRTESALFNIGFRYATPLGERQQVVTVNGKDYGYFMFPDSKTWKEGIVVKRVPIRSGVNEITVTKNYGWMYFDYLYLETYVDAPYALSELPVSPNALASCKEVYNFLKSTFTKKSISGAMTLQGGEEYSMVEPNWLYQNTGKYPALLGLDFMHQTGKESAWYYDDPVFSKQVVRDSTNYWRRGGLVALCWHWRDPLQTTNNFYSPSSNNPATNFDVEKAVIDGTAENKAVLADLKAVGDQLEALQTAGISVLWRPLHEGSGKWFWWGYKGPVPYKKLWKIEFDYFTKTRKLTNLLWVFTAGTPSAGIEEWYPGDDVVDVIGMDIYPTKGDHSSQYAEFGHCKETFKGKKIIALSECGSIPDPELMKEDVAPWAYFMPWYKEYIIPEAGTPYNSLDFWKRIMKLDFVVTLDKMPGWKA
jgi:mannan endo-1,4-beta-mannosidase